MIEMSENQVFKVFTFVHYCSLSQGSISNLLQRLPVSQSPCSWELGKGTF